MVAPVGPTLLTCRHGPTSGSLPTGPTVITWSHKWVPTDGSHRHNVTLWSHPVDVATGFHQWSQRVPRLMWPCEAESAARMVFILFGKKTRFMGAWIPRPITARTGEVPPDYSIVCTIVLYVALFV